MKRFVLVLLACGFAAVASAQTAPEETLSWDIEFWSAGVNPATGTPIQSANILKSASTCDLVPTPENSPTGLVTNPTRIFVQDPERPLRRCQLAPTTSSGLLMSLPAQAGMFATALGRGATLTASARSAASNPFNRLVVTAPPVTTGVAVGP